MPDTLSRPFSWRGCEFICSAFELNEATYQPRVMYRCGMANVQQVELPQDTEAYGSPEEALRHAEQQAVRWVNERSTEGQNSY